MTTTTTRAYGSYDMQREDIDNHVNRDNDGRNQIANAAGTSGQWVATPKWVLAGKATFTVANPSGDFYTYRVCKVESEGPPRPTAWFVKLLGGPDNDDEGSYLYLGMLAPQEGAVRLTKASRLGEDSKPVKVVRWALAKVWAGKPLPEGYSIDHNGTCARCGRTLTRPEGTREDGYRFGFGPVCWDKIQQGL